jgi:putative hemolysin
MTSILTEVFLIALLMLANGLFAMAEIAVVASRRARLKTLAEEGSAGAAKALKMAESPGRFLSTVQVGITLFGILSGVIGGARIGPVLAEPFRPLLGPWADFLSLVVVTGAVTYFSVTIGELVPKRLALNHPERIASILAGPMAAFSSLTAPLVHVLNGSTDLLMCLLGIRKAPESSVSEEEVRVLIDEGLSSGVFNKEEKEMVESVFELDEQTAEDLMTPRPRIVWLNVDDSDEENWRRIAGSGHSHFPVFRKTRDNVVGMVSVKSLWANLSLAGSADLMAVITPPVYVPTTMPAGMLIAEFKKTGTHIALVVDEFGGLEGLVTVKDVMMAIVGDLPEREQRQEARAVRRDDGTWLVDALLDIESTKEALGIESDLPGEDEFSTLGGFLLNSLGHIPGEGEKLVWTTYEFEVVDMDRQRIDKVLVTKLPEPEPESGDGAQI